MLLYCCFYICIQKSPCFAQNENNYWYFGSNAGLDFLSGTARALQDGQLRSESASSVASDQAGNLLFYTDGQTVWNRSHRVMANGTGLSGNPKLVQGTIIVPFPEKPNQYFIFSLGSQDQSPVQLYYSIVNLELEGGLGRVIQKNIPLRANLTERLAAVRHCNGIDFWVMVHEWNSNRFLAFEVNKEGVKLEPVITSVGAVHRGHPDNGRGYLKFASYGNRLAVAIEDTQVVEIFDFFPNNGRLVFKASLAPNFQMSGFHPYGLEFSPDNTKLYVGSRKEPFLYQFDVSAPDIAATQFLLGVTPLGALQLGLDGRIYAARPNSNFLAVIRFPNNPGFALGYVQDGFNIAPRQCRLGLPNFTQVYTRPALASPPQRTTFCEGDSIVLYALTGPGYRYEWKKDRIKIPGADSSTLTVKESGLYSVTVFDLQGCAYIYDILITKLPTPRIKRADTVCLDAFRYIPSRPDPAGGMWNGPAIKDPFTGEIDIIQLGVGGPYNYTYSLPGTCQRATFELTIADSIDAQFTTIPTNTDSLYLPNNATVQFFNQTLNASHWVFLFGDGNSSTELNPIHTYRLPGKYKARLMATNWAGCQDTAEKEITVIQLLKPVPNVFTPNNDGINDTFVISSLGIKKITMLIQDRWGIPIFKTENALNEGWNGLYNGNGEAVAEGTYFYLLQIETFSNEILFKTGTITLLR
ncbi:MAG: gliding motility-associated C-terminal domain-containing protein [Bacteroidia bacterium]|nr:gliding motility-associated C-terminal domain-containing protein [Bacteroidia bacterium]MDW8157464.1 gliding motility-associated C-terminal domain-containing protein [Bacteroidia bacterium]